MEWNESESAREVQFAAISATTFLLDEISEEKTESQSSMRLDDLNMQSFSVN